MPVVPRERGGAAVTVGRFARAQATAKRLIAKYGERSTHVRVTDAAPPDSTKPWLPGTPTTTSTIVDAVWLDWDRGRVDGTVIREGDRKVLIPATELSSAPDPTKDLMVRIDGSRWQVTLVNVLQPNEDSILYELNCRGQSG